MRAVLGIVSLLVVLALVGLLTRKSLDATRSTLPDVQAPATSGAATPAALPAGTVREKSQSIEQQYKQALENALHQQRPEPAE